MRKFLQRIGFFRKKEYKGTLRKTLGEERNANATSRKANFFTNFATIINIIGLVLTARGVVVIAAKNNRKEDTKIVKGTTVVSKGFSSKGILAVVSETLESLIMLEQRRGEEREMEAMVDSPDADAFLRSITKGLNGGKDGQ